MPTPIWMNCIRFIANRARPTAVEQNGCVVGGGGVAPLSCSEPDICELQKCIFTGDSWPGLAKKLALMALDHAREQGFKRCYLETTAFYARRLRYTNV